MWNKCYINVKFQPLFFIQGDSDKPFAFALKLYKSTNDNVPYQIIRTLH